MGGKNVRGRGRQGGVSCKEGLAGSKCQSERLGRAVAMAKCGPGILLQTSLHGNPHCVLTHCHVIEHSVLILCHVKKQD